MANFYSWFTAKDILIGGMAKEELETATLLTHVQQ